MQDYTNITLGEWLKKWYEIYKKPYLSTSSLSNIEMTIRLHIPEEMKSMRITEISPLMLEHAIGEVMAPRMRQYTWQVLNSAFERAALFDIIPRNPMKFLLKVKHKQKVGSALTALEIKDFKRKIKRHPLRNLFEFYLYTGCRRSEALIIRKSDVDLSAGTLHIPGTKSATSNRVIPIFEPLRYVIARVIDNANPYLFDVTGDYVSRAFKALCPNHKLHDLRHTFATHCLQCGISMKVVQLWLGHSNFETTASIYTHVVDDFQRIEAGKLSWY